MRKKNIWESITDIKIDIIAALLIVYMQIMYTLPATNKKINTVFIKTIYSCVIGSTKQMTSTCTIFLLCTVLLPISTEKFHLKILISRISHPQCLRVICNLFFELKMIFAIKNRVSPLQRLEQYFKVWCTWTAPPDFCCLEKARQPEFSDWEQDSSYQNFTCQDGASCIS